MEIGQMNGTPILILIAVALIIYFATRKSNKSEDKSETPVINQDIIQQVKSQYQSQKGPEDGPQSQLAWISTKTRLPELYTEVTIFTQDKEILHDWARVNDTDYIHSKNDITINNVTHWMSINIPTNIPQTENPIDRPPRFPR